MAQPIRLGPFQELNLRDGFWPQPQCRMADYAAWAAAGVAITALSGTLFGMISLSFPAWEHRLPFHW